jgi:hypothetical protein
MKRVGVLKGGYAPEPEEGDVGGGQLSQRLKIVKWDEI